MSESTTLIAPATAARKTPVEPLFERVRLGRYDLPHRMVMAPLTRSRARHPGNVPSAVNACYYAQRASAALIVTEATQVSQQGQGYAWTPGIHSREQVEGWRLVTDAVHKAGGLIFLQLWHVGRISHPSLQPDGMLPVAPSAIKASGEAFIENENGEGELVPFVTPRALQIEAEPTCHPCFEYVRQRLRVSSIPADDRRRRRSRRRPERHGDTAPHASVVAGIIVLIDISGDIGLQPHGAEVVSNQPADRELALFLVARDGSAQVHGSKSDRAQLPFVELLGRRQIDVDEVRIAAVQAERSGTRRDLRPVGDGVKVDAINDIRGQIRAAAIEGHPRAAWRGAPQPPLSLPEPIENIRSAVCFGWTPKATIAVVSGLENWPVFPFKGGEQDHKNRLEACRALASDTARSLRSGRWNARPDYAETLDQYVAYLPVQPEEGNFLLADAEARIIRAMFAADVNILPSGLAAKLKVFLEQHIGLRAYYPATEDFYESVRSGHLETPLPIDAVEGFIQGVRDNTPTLFEPNVSQSLEGVARSIPSISPADAGVPKTDEAQPAPPPDPLGEIDPAKARRFTLGGTVNALWKAFSNGEKIAENVEGWAKVAETLMPYVLPILTWLRSTH
jgi:NADH:flavin oxidoreductase / NADH oxidase family